MKPAGRPSAESSEAGGLPEAPELAGVPETLLIPLYSRFLEQGRSDALFKDPRAPGLVQSLPYDFDRFAGLWRAHAAIAVRTAILDGAVASFLESSSGAGVLNLGAGLCTRYDRLVSSGGRRCDCWWDVDLPEVEPLWRRCFREGGCRRFAAGSALEVETWSGLDRLGHPDTGPVLIVAEGLLMYFDPEEVRQLLGDLAARFPGAEMLLETAGPGTRWTQRREARQSRVTGRFRWFLEDPGQLEAWVPGSRVLRYWSVVTEGGKRWGWLGRLARARWLGPVARQLRGLARVIHLRFP